MAARAARPWRRAAIVAIAVHAVLITLAIRSVRIVGPPPDTRAFDVRLVQLRPPPPRPRQPRTAKTAPSSAPAPAASTPPTAAVLTPAATAIAAEPSPSDDAAGRIRAMLRGSTGCDSAAFLKLSEAEKQKCAAWRVANVDRNVQVPLAIDPVKTSWYERDMQYRKAGQYMPIGPPGRGVAVTPGLPPGHPIVRVGPLNIGIPPGAFNDDDAPPP